MSEPTTFSELRSWIDSIDDPVSRSIALRTYLRTIDMIRKIARARAHDGLVSAQSLNQYLSRASRMAQSTSPKTLTPLELLKAQRAKQYVAS